MKTPLQEKLGLFETTFGDGRGKRFALVSGLHGDELDGLYLSYRLAKFLRAWEDSGKPIRGQVSLIPVANPLATAAAERFWPFGQIDVNRCFPGRAGDEGAPFVWAGALFEHLKTFDLAMDVHSSNLFLRECPQVRVVEKFREAVEPYAGQANVDVVWIHDAPTVIETTLSYNLNAAGVPTLVVEMGVGYRIQTQFVDAVFRGVLNLLMNLNILSDALDEPVKKKAIYATERNVRYLNSDSGGFFVPEAQVGSTVRSGDRVGEILNALTGEVKEPVVSKWDGYLFTVRAHPIVYPGSLMARIIET
ncbi:succinylglutamate desuccinylase/aspartoacylase family protein [bacterium]|nr:succinylglutamate desuccinylase/aspartoacylase family protein [bacterium]